MEIIVNYRHHNPSASLSALIEKELQRLGQNRQIDQARLSLEQHAEASPSFRASAHLVTPGPDLFAEAEDHTLRAALMKVVAQLEQAIGHRQQKRTRKTTGAAKTAPPALVAASVRR